MYPGLAIAAQASRNRGHSTEWWAQFQEVSDRFDAASVTEGLADAIIPKIPSPLLRREAEIAAEVVVLYLNKAASDELAGRSRKAVDRLVATVSRLTERSTAEEAGTDAAYALCHALEGRWADAAAEAEPLVGTQALLRVFVKALRLERFDMSLAVRLLRAGQQPDIAVQSGLVVGKYAWWPAWLIKIVTERAMAGTLDDDTIMALDRCAYAELSPAQARMARRLLNGDEMLIDGAAFRLEAMGEPRAAAKLREGDLTAVALAARLIPL
ncbi:hypothetical protein [Paractinoplanes durhamensis]|uniref:DUF222 domain-containing protein n=1 Tax=Paractinoplanes durhamensis TaxID=113563 RepID=A0ABQ3Z590_9ACTN|nr:hypothetical protein [Actinoplanes durhamensis]GIE05007.1 hypothetical protein Adu01nite_63570 [Actinoplanes durhamensis]